MGTPLVEIIVDSIAHNKIDDEAVNAINLANAAPDLLDALKRILAAHESGNNGAVMGEAMLCKYFVSMAKYAIAKAEGHQ